MHEVHLRNLDLNLLIPLHALLEERHVTRAAKAKLLEPAGHEPGVGAATRDVRRSFVGSECAAAMNERCAENVCYGLWTHSCRGLRA